MPGEIVLAVDIGTSATKVVLFDAALRPLRVVRKTYPVHMPHSGWSEQEPVEIYRAVLAALREGCQAALSHGRLLAVAFSAQMNNILAVDAHGQALTPAMTWADTRSAASSRAIRQHPGAAGLSQRTGCPIDPIYPLSKIHWMKSNLDLPPRVRFVSIKEYVFQRLTGHFLADWSIASSSGLLNTASNTWDAGALELLELHPGQLSELVSPRHSGHDWLPAVLEGAGLPPGTPWVTGGGDGPLASLGVGAVQPGVLAVNVGTSAAARTALRRPWTDPQARLWTYVADEGLWVVGGIVSSGGMAWDWYLQAMGPTGTDNLPALAEVERLAGETPSGAEGLVFIPYLGGEQSPGWRPEARGTFFGLDFKHGRGHLARAVLEGIARSIYRVVETIDLSLEQPMREVRVTGGLSASPLWLQIAADLFNLPVLVPESVEGSARGAAMLALLSLGYRDRVEDFEPVFAVEKQANPNPDTRSVYNHQRQVFERLLEMTGNSLF